MDSSFRCCFAAILKSFHSSLFSHIFFHLLLSHSAKRQVRILLLGRFKFSVPIKLSAMLAFVRRFFLSFFGWKVSFTCYDRFSVCFLTAWKWLRINFSHFRFVSESEEIYINNCMYLCFFFLSFSSPLQWISLGWVLVSVFACSKDFFSLSDRAWAC